MNNHSLICVWCVTIAKIITFSTIIIFRHRYASAYVTFKWYLKLTEVRWGSGNPFTGRSCMNRMYDTIESVSNYRRTFHCFLRKCHTWEKDLFWYDYVRCLRFLTKIYVHLLVISLENTLHLTMHSTLL